MKLNKNAKLIKNPEKLDLARVGALAEARKFYTINSEKDGIVYCYNDGEYAIITHSKGLLRLSEDDLDIILAELTMIRDDVEYLKNAERR